MLICVKEVNDNKRFIAFFSDGSTTKFGLTNQKIGTNIDHNDKKLRTNYIKRRLKDLQTHDYKQAGYLSLFLLWNKLNLKESVKDFNKRIKNNNFEIKSI